MSTDRDPCLRQSASSHPRKSPLQDKQNHNALIRRRTRFYTARVKTRRLRRPVEVTPENGPFRLGSDRVSPRALVPPMHLSTRHGWPDVHVVAVSFGTVLQSGDPKSEPPGVWRCYRASVPPVAPVVPPPAGMFLGALEH